MTHRRAGGAARPAFITPPAPRLQLAPAQPRPRQQDRLHVADVSGRFDDVWTNIVFWEGFTVNKLSRAQPGDATQHGWDSEEMEEEEVKDPQTVQ